MVSSVSVSVAAEDQLVRGISVEDEAVVHAAGGVLNARVISDGDHAGTARVGVDVVDVVQVVGVGCSVARALQPPAAH